MIYTIAEREVRGGLVTPLIWVLLVAGQIVLAWIFLQAVDAFSASTDQKLGLTLQLSLNLCGFTAVITMLAAPLLAMRMFSGEFRDGSHDLIGAAPVSIAEVLIGKFLGLWALMTPLCLLPGLNLLLLAGSAPLDPGQFAAAILGLWLATGMFCAIGLYASSLTSQPGTSVLIAFGILLLLSVIGRVEAIDARSLTLFGWLSWNEHLFWFLLGAVRMSDLVYFALFIVFFLALTHRRLANRRL